MEHRQLKCEAIHYRDIIVGNKRVEIRQEDPKNPFRVGEIIKLINTENNDFHFIKITHKLLLTKDPKCLEFPDYYFKTNYPVYALSIALL